MEMYMCHYMFGFAVTGDDLWRGVTSVSNAGSKRGRGKGTGKKRAMNLNRGQKLGEG